MIKLFKLLFLFLIPIFLVCILDAIILPPTFFTHRVWDGLAFTNQKDRPFFPNYFVEKDEIGDLGFHTNKAIIKHVKWKTDNFGFRNDSVIHDPDILLIGDSFVVGCSLSQENTINSILNEETKKQFKIYNIAPSSFSVFMSLLNNHIISKPKLIILFSIERFMFFKSDTIESRSFNKSIPKNNIEVKFDEYKERINKFTSIHWFNALFCMKTGMGIQSTINNKMLFLEGKESILKDSLLYCKSIVALKRINQKCKNMGIQFLFIPMPNKESVYWELVPYKKQPNLLFSLDSALHNEKIATINTLALYNKEKKNGTWLYHFDDTHWNKNGVKVVAKEIVKYIDTLKVFHEHKN
jgi:alginate O-acetyltransferase complex protein AlgJ